MHKKVAPPKTSSLQDGAELVEVQTFVVEPG